MTQQTLMQLKKTVTPAQFSQTLREMGEIFWWEPGKFFVITSYDLAKEALMSPDYTCDRSPFFISRMPEMDLSLIQDFFKVVGLMMVMSDAPLHTSRRRICYHGFTIQRLEQLMPLVHATIQQCLTRFQPNAPFDFVKEVAEMIPSVTLAEFFAIPDHERLSFYEWSNNMTQFFGGSTTYFNEDGIKVNHSAKKLYDYFADLLAKRRHDPKTDFLSSLIQHQQSFGLSDDEIISQAIMMLVAGQITTTDQMCNNLYILLQTNQWEFLANHLELLEQYLEECNRLDPAVTFIFRVVKKDTQLGNQFLKAGSVIFIATHAVNRDPKYFPAPDTIQIEKRNTPHFSYGYGGHFCLGAKLARMEMQAVFTSLLQAYPTLKMDPALPPIRKHHSLSFSGFMQFGLKV
jgi:cytochrome P450 PksS